jgi:hypothetical protein
VPRPGPLRSGDEARRTIAHRFTRLADRLRQLNTRFGMRSNRVFLTWTRWTGEARGEGREEVLARVELLPTPKVTGEASILRRAFAQGVLPDGVIVLTEISAGAFTRDQLTGLKIPGPGPEAPGGTPGTPVAGEQGDPRSDPRVDFFYELVEDGRGDAAPDRDRFRVRSRPERKEGSLYWIVILERADQDMGRDGLSAASDDDVMVPP